MKKLFIIVNSSIVMVLAASSAALGQEGCGLDVVGTWESADANGGVPTRYHFAPDGTVTTHSRDGSGTWKEAAGSTFRYKLDNPKAPKVIAFTGAAEAARRGSVKILEQDEAGFTTVDGAGDTVRWVRADDPHRYFVVLAADKGTIQDGAHSFAMLIRTNGDQAQGHALGIYLVEDDPRVGPLPVFGHIPHALREKFMSEPRAGSNTMLRLEVTPATFERSMQVLRNWDRRIRENVLLYEIPYLNNMVYIEEMAKTLDGCAEKVDLYPLTWSIHDEITSKRNLTQIPYYYIKALRDRNGPLHVTDGRFQVPAPEWTPVPPRKAPECHHCGPKASGVPAMSDAPVSLMRH